MKKVNIAIGGGSCTGKSTLAAELFATLNNLGYDFDLVMEASRRIKKEFNACKSPFDRFFLWIIQEQEERCSTAKNGFITDIPLFHYYAHALQWVKTKRDQLAVQELLRMSSLAKETYALAVLHKNPKEIPYRKDGSRMGGKEHARVRNVLVRSFVELYMQDRIIYVDGSLEKRVAQVLQRLYKMGFTKIPKKLRTF